MEMDAGKPADKTHSEHQLLLLFSCSLPLFNFKKHPLILNFAYTNLLCYDSVCPVHLSDFQRY